ncbi:uncharacterized protein KY384_001630 [Bacidia gigantensis]|uniref:uncharacterized protein n=1 Tax=Bacidia gigantensis TaxID=2732470 RepID=UPI001D0367C1|nr:uncharacterized protein KY384_001630 [Bacidia gigantensis]KAG8533889.1 hypothetical protein KY384_001630 [Bacidia gigantensis]
MFVKKPRQNDSFTKKSHDSFSKHRAGKSVSKSRTQRSFKDHTTATSRRTEKASKTSKQPVQPSQSSPNNLNSPIITLSIGPSARLFAAHESILTSSPFFNKSLTSAFLESSQKRISLPEELPEVFSSVLEYLYKGDYYPKLLHNKRRDRWELEDAPPPPASTTVPVSPAPNATVWHAGANLDLLKDTLVYCAADRYDLPDLKRLALRKQGLQSGIGVGTILGSARYAYANTPESDSKLRAHYLALIIRSRQTFKRSGTMQAEMERGGGEGLWFDLFVAMCNHLDDLNAVAKSPRTPRTL